MQVNPVRFAAVAAAACLLLTGCRASGTVQVRSADEVFVDLTFVDVSYQQAPCNPHEWGPNFPLETQPGVNPDDLLTCRVHGVTHPARLSGHLTLVAAGEYLSFAYNPLAIGPDGRQPIGPTLLDIDELDLTVTFPGQVLSTTGQADGSTVRYTDPDQLDRGYGLQATALDHPGPAWSILGPIVGLLAGLVLAGLWWFVRRPRAKAELGSAAPAETRQATEPSAYVDPFDADPPDLDPDARSRTPADRPRDDHSNRPDGGDNRWAPPPG